MCRPCSENGKPKILLPFDRREAWDFSDEKIASLRRSLVTGSKYSVVDRASTYTPTASQRAAVGRPVDSVFQVFSEEQTKLQKEDDKHLFLPNEVDLSPPFHCKDPASSADGPPPCPLHTRMNQPETGASGVPRRTLLTADGFQNLTSILEP